MVRSRLPIRILQFLLTCLTPLMLGCVEDDPVRSRSVESLPAQFRLQGLAHSSESGKTVDCSFDFIFEMRGENSRTAQLVEYRGVQGGEINRTILAADGSGFSFFADSFGEVVARLMIQTGQVELTIPINTTAEGRFWQNLASFPGNVYATGFGSGTWTCAPLDIEQNGYVDTSIVAPGQWKMEPIQ